MRDRVAFVTGASQGIGLACATALAAEGARVVVAARQEEKLAALVNDIEGMGGVAHAVRLDVASAESITEAFAAAEEALGKVEILVNNAGITRDGLAARMKPGAWDAVLQTNLTGAFQCIQKVLPGMMKVRWGRIINVTSVVAQTGNAGQANYCAAKAGLIGLTKSLAKELASRSITVNAVAPGFIETAMTGALPDKAKEAILDQVPLRRMGLPDDIAAAVEYLASDRAGYVTGHTLNVNGGIFAG